MIREAAAAEASIVSDRLAAEILNAGLSYTVPAGGAIMMDIAAGKTWLIDDAEPRVVMHAYKDWAKLLKLNGSVAFEGYVVFVDHVWGPSVRHLELLRFLANFLLAKYGDLYGVYPRGNTIANAADTALTPALRGSRSFIKLSDGAAKLNALVP